MVQGATRVAGSKAAEHGAASPPGLQRLLACHRWQGLAADQPGGTSRALRQPCTKADRRLICSPRARKESGPSPTYPVSTLSNPAHACAGVPNMPGSSASSPARQAAGPGATTPAPARSRWPPRSRYASGGAAARAAATSSAAVAGCGAEGAGGAGRAAAWTAAPACRRSLACRRYACTPLQRPGTPT